MMDFDTLKQLVAQHHGLSIQELDGRGRRVAVVQARYMLWHLAAYKLGMTRADIGAANGGRSHSNITCGLKLYAGELRYNKVLAHRLHQIEKIFNPKI